MRTVLCTGSRSWDDMEGIYDALNSIRRPFRIIVGDAKDGADPIFWSVAEALEVPRLRFNARWKVFGKSAGFKRNGVMVMWLVRLHDRGHPAIVLAAWDGKSRGTKDTMDKARAHGFDPWRINI